MHAVRIPTRLLIVPMILGALTLPVHGQTPKPIVWDAAGTTVTGVDIDAAAQRIPAPSRPSVMSRSQNIARQAEEVYIRRKLALEAEAAGRDKDPLTQALLRQARERILSDAQLAAIEGESRPSDEAVAAFARETYRAAPNRFQAPAQTRARHILIGRAEDGKERERAQAILDQLKAGASFDDLAKQHSADHATAGRGGDLGFFAQGTMVKPFEDAISQLQTPGQLSGLIETQFGIHIARLEARRPAGILPFDEVRESLEREVRSKAQADARQAYVERLINALQADLPEIEAIAQRYAGSANPKP